VVDIALHNKSGKREAPLKGSFSLFGLKLSSLDLFLLGAISVILLLQLHLQFVQKVNWDEFFYLSHIYDAQEGRLTKVLQMGHVYLFGWLTKIPGGEMVQITVGRVVMWAAQIGILALIVKTARRFMPLTAALFSALCFLGLGFVFIHGTSFRADPMAALCIIYAVYIFTVSELKPKDLAALSVALALGAMITIKVILFVPLFAVLAVWRLFDAEVPKTLFIKFSAALFCAIGLFIFGLLLHDMSLPTEESSGFTSPLSSTAETVFLSGGLFPRRNIMEVGFYTGLVPSIMALWGLCVALWSVAKNKASRRVNIILLAMALPLLTFVFYRNAYPYFYIFICPSAVILAGYAVYKLKLAPIVLVALTGLIGLSTTALYKGRLDETRQVQTETLAAVHKIFPEPVHYFDRNGMIASFPKAGFFMSSWGIRNYQMAGDTRFITEMENKVVPLLIDNSPEISKALRGESSALLKEDAMALKDNYIPHWGHIWVAGKSLSISNQTKVFTVLIPGHYTVESQDAVILDERLYDNGTSIFLDRGLHEVNSEIEQGIILRWGHQTPRPSHSANPNSIFGAF